jgi:NHL repeat-containing protein/PEP-CTERM motif-containing protein
MNSKRTTLVLTVPLPLRTGRAAIAPASLLCLLTLLATVFTARPAQATQVLLVASGFDTVGKYDAVTGAAINVPFFWAPSAHSMVLDQYNHLFVAGDGVSEYNATTGATINANFITGLYNPTFLALDGNNHLFVSNDGSSNIVGEYDATTGATINASFIQDLVSSPGLYNPHGVAVDNKNHLFVADHNANTVGEYDATTGATINAAFIKSQGQGLHNPDVLLLDGHNHLLVGDNYDTDTVGMYDATTGATINAALVPGLNGGTAALALDGNNHLFVANYNRSVGEYDATTGATINENFIAGPSYISGLAFVTAVPEPSTFALAAVGFLSLFVRARQRSRHPGHSRQDRMVCWSVFCDDRISGGKFA